MSLFYIALGGRLGAVLRFLLTEYVNNNISNLMPFGTLVVNVLGCFLIGCIAGFFASKSSPMFLFFVIGFLGSFTTMSAFSIQTIELFNSNTLSTSDVKRFSILLISSTVSSDSFFLFFSAKFIILAVCK